MADSSTYSRPNRSSPDKLASSINGLNVSSAPQRASSSPLKSDALFVSALPQPSVFFRRNQNSLSQDPSQSLHSHQSQQPRQKSPQIIQPSPQIWPSNPVVPMVEPPLISAASVQRLGLGAATPSSVVVKERALRKLMDIEIQNENLLRVNSNLEGNLRKLKIEFERLRCVLPLSSDLKISISRRLKINVDWAGLIVR